MERAEIDQVRADEDAEQPHPCDEPGCSREGSACYLPDALGEESDPEPHAFYCAEHATKNGFCWSCGWFWSGVEDFDFDPNGLCSNCRDEFGDDEPDHDYDYYDAYDGGFPS